MPDNLDPARTALLFFDLLKGSVDRHPERSRAVRAAGVIANCARVLAEGRAAGVAVFYARAAHRPDGADAGRQRTDADMELQRREPGAPASVDRVYAGTPDAEVIDDLCPMPEDYDVPKKRWSAFFGTSLELSLRTRGVDTIVLMGVSTEVGIASTAYAARDRDYNLVIVRDGCWSRRPVAHDVFMDRVFPLMARVRTADQVVAMLVGERA